MTARELYQFCKKYNLQDATLSYPLYDTGDILADVNLADVTLTSDCKKPKVVLLNAIKTD